MRQSRQSSCAEAAPKGHRFPRFTAHKPAAEAAAPLPPSFQAGAPLWPAGPAGSWLRWWPGRRGAAGGQTGRAWRCAGWSCAAGARQGRRASFQLSASSRVDGRGLGLPARLPATTPPTPAASALPPPANNHLPTTTCPPRAPEVPGRACQGLEVVVPVLVKGVAAARAHLPQNAVVQDAHRLCGARRGGQHAVPPRSGGWYRGEASGSASGPGVRRRHALPGPAQGPAQGGRAGHRCHRRAPLSPSPSGCPACSLVRLTLEVLQPHFVPWVQHGGGVHPVPHPRPRAAKAVAIHLSDPGALALPRIVVASQVPGLRGTAAAAAVVGRTNPPTHTRLPTALVLCASACA